MELTKKKKKKEKERFIADLEIYYLEMQRELKSVGNVRCVLNMLDI